MNTLRWAGLGLVVAAFFGSGCSGDVSNGGTATCSPQCAAPPQGCHFEGAATCDPPACPSVVCEDAGITDASPDASPDAFPDASEDVSCQVDCAPPPAGCHYEGQGSCDPPACPPLVCLDATTVDAPEEPYSSDGSMPSMDEFATTLNGIWLIGWSGGLNHYSWVRIKGGPQFNGTAEFLAGADLFANAPFWDCSGAGTWMLTQQFYTVGFYFPASCAQGFDAYTFLSLDMPLGGPPGAILHASLKNDALPGAPLDAFKFPDYQCDVAMTTCQDPWK